MSIVLQSSGGGQITISEPATASNFTQTLPAADGVTMVSGNMPAFSVYASGTEQSISNSTATKILFAAEDFDTNSNFASSRFTPTVAGYYQINANFTSQTSTGTISRTIIYIYKNGAVYRRGGDLSGLGLAIGISDVVYLNGTTDYVEIYGLISTSGSPAIGRGENSTFFSGVLVRAA